jgi:hypothetical protein
VAKGAIYESPNLFVGGAAAYGSPGHVAGSAFHASNPGTSIDHGELLHFYRRSEPFWPEGIAGRAFRPPFEWEFFVIQIEEIGWRSLPLILAAGFAFGVVLSLHTRATLVQIGAEGLIPNLQSASFFNELGPLVTALQVAGRVGAGIGAGRKTGAV